MDPFTAEADCSAWQIAMGAFSLAQHVIAVRYHTAVLSLATGRIPYNIHYSNKGRDLCERLGVPGCPLEGMAEEATLEKIFSFPATAFDHRKLRLSVRSDFQECMSSLPAMEKI
jgi:polysaccharide pyruvyl transferase WcaK-like protein